VFNHLARNLPSELRTNNGRIAIMHAALDSSVKDICERVAETIVGSNGVG
jgi:hypothetical protein